MVNVTGENGVCLKRPLLLQRPRVRVIQKRFKPINIRCQAVGTTQEPAQNIVEYQKKLTIAINDEREILSLKTHLANNIEYMNPIIVSAALSTLRKIIAEYNEGVQITNITPKVLTEDQKANLQEIYKQLIPYLWEYYPQMTTLGISNSIQSLGTASDLLGLPQAIEGVNDLTILLIEKLVERRSEAKLDYLIRALNHIVDNQLSSEENIHILLKEILQYPIMDIKRWNAVYMLKILVKIEPTNYEELFRFMSYFVGRYGKSHISNEIMYVNLMLAAAKARYHFKDINNIISQVARICLRPSSTLLVSMADIIANQYLQFENKEIMASRMANCVTRVNGTNCKLGELVDLIYYVSSAKCKQYELQSLVDELQRKIQNVEDLSNEQKLRLRWAQLFSKAHKQQIIWQEKLLDICQVASVSHARDKVSQLRQDEFVLEVFNAIKQQYSNVQCGALIKNDELVISILVEEGGQKVAVEPRHSNQLLSGEPYSLLGTLQSELIVYESLGYKVVAVSERQWRLESVEKTLQRVNGCFEDNYSKVLDDQIEKVEC